MKLAESRHDDNGFDSALESFRITAASAGGPYARLEHHHTPHLPTTPHFFSTLRTGELDLSMRSLESIDAIMRILLTWDKTYLHDT